MWPQRLPVQVRSLTLEKVQAYLPAKYNLVASSPLNTFNTFSVLLTLQEISNVGCRCSVCVSSGQRGFVHERLPVDSSLQAHPHPVVLMPQLPPRHTQPVVETADVAFSPQAPESRADPLPFTPLTPCTTIDSTAHGFSKIAGRIFRRRPSIPSSRISIKCTCQRPWSEPLLDCRSPRVAVATVRLRVPGIQADGARQNSIPVQPGLPSILPSMERVRLPAKIW